VRIHYKFTYCFKCPECGTEYYSLIADKGKWKCYKCGFVFGDAPEPIPPKYWEGKIVEAIECDRCGRLVTCTPENFSLASDVQAVLCPFCLEHGRVFAQHLLAIFYRGKWREPKFFLYKKNADGIREVRSYRDKITVWLIASECKLDTPSLSSSHVFQKGVHAKILWKDGEAIGYYTYTVDLWEYPTLHTIGVRRKFRGRGFGTLLLKDFLSSFRGKVGIESPNETVCRILERLGEVEKRGDAYYSKGRVVFISAG